MKLKITGVPEHFNLPWHLAIENGDFKKEGIDLIWEEAPGGTGAMCKALRSGDADIAIVLTEGIIADISKGNPSKIVGQYVKSSLIWGIHTAQDSKFQTANDLQGANYAISRFGSGSHIMTFVDAINRNWDPAKQNFLKVGNLTGAREALVAKTADALLWEKFTTKPYVDSGELRRIGETVTPWPCFVIAVRNEILENHPDEISKLLKVIYKSCNDFMFQADAKSVSTQMVSERYDLRISDVKEWFAITKWATDTVISRAVIRNVVDTLNDVGVLDQSIEPEALCDKNFVEFEKKYYNFTDKKEQQEFFVSGMSKALLKLKRNSQPLWGLMTAQHMVEHLTTSLYMSLGKFEIPLKLEGESLAKARAFLLGPKPLSKSVPKADTEVKLQALRNPDLESAIVALKATVQLFDSAAKNSEAKLGIHPYGGDFNGEEWNLFNYKHFIHHFNQFELL